MNPIRENEEAIREACKRFKVRSLYLFGSYADRSNHEFSDFDFIVDFDRVGFEGAFEQFMGFKEDLEAILGLPVDLLTSSRFRNEVFQKEVERSKRLVYAA